MPDIYSFLSRFYDQDEIESFCTGNSRIDASRKLECLNVINPYGDCQFYLSQEEGYVYWIVAIRDGDELARWNTAYVEEIVWKYKKKLTSQEEIMNLMEKWENSK